MLKKILAIFMLLFLAARPAIAQEEAKFTEISAGEPSPYDGYVFTKPAVARLYSTVEEKEKQKDLFYTTKINLLNLDIKKLEEVHLVQIKNKDLLFNNVVNEKNITIKKLSNQIETTQVIIIGSFILGSLLGGFLVAQLSGN